MYYPSLFATLVLVACAVTPALSSPLPYATVPLDPARLADLFVILPVTLTLVWGDGQLPSAETEIISFSTVRRPMSRPIWYLLDGQGSSCGRILSIKSRPQWPGYQLTPQGVMVARIDCFHLLVPFCDRPQKKTSTIAVKPIPTVSSFYLVKLF
jgi:hypothetical protein